MGVAWEPLASVAILTGSLRLRELHRIRNLLGNAAPAAAPERLLRCRLGTYSCTGIPIAVLLTVTFAFLFFMFVLFLPLVFC